MLPARVLHLLSGPAAIALALTVTSVEARGQFAPGVDVRQGMPLRVYVRDAPPRESALAYVSPSALHVRERCDSCDAVIAIPWSDVTRVDGIVASPLEEVAVTDTIPLQGAAIGCKKLRVMSIARLLGEAIKRIHHGDSISSLFI